MPGSWRYRVWATHDPSRDMMEVRATRVRKNVDVDSRGRKYREFEHEYAWYDRENEGFDWRPHSEGSTIKPFLTISGRDFLTIDEDEGEELLSALLPYRTDIELREEKFLI